MMRGGGKDEKNDVSGGSGATGAGDPPDAQVAISPPPTPDAAAEVTPPPTPDAGAGSATPQVRSSELELECLRYENDQNWNDLDSCADRLKALNPAAAKGFKNRAALETRAALKVIAVETALKDRNLKKAKAELEQIPNSAS